MIELVVFDLDGVLVSSKDMHFESLNKALKNVGDEFVISYDEHLKKFDGLPTRRKLAILTKERGLPENKHDAIWEWKQQATVGVISKNVTADQNKIHLFKTLKDCGYKIYIASNAIHQTVKMYLIRLGLIEFVDHYISNEDVCQAKPHPNIYLHCMVHACTTPKQTLIVEDSHAGLTAATESGAYVCRVLDPEDTSIAKITDAIAHINNVPKTSAKWYDDCLNIVIPMAGAGSRFEAAGYTFPKPLIDVFGQPMIQSVVDNLNIDGQFIFIVQRSHYERYNLQHMLNLIAPKCKIIQVDGITEGAACTTLLARDLINNNHPLLFANSDQHIDWNSTDFMYNMQAGNVDGGILTFENTHPKWSYASIGTDGYVIEVAEKNPISTHATVGIYYWKHGRDYVRFAEQMIAKDIRVNNEFYVCPVFNEAIADGLKIRTWNVDNMWGLGTPEDLRYFMEHYKHG